MTHFADARTHMVQSQILTNGVVNPAVVAAFSEIPRELFVPEEARACCYADKEVNLGGGRFLLEPMLLARMIEALNLRAGDYALDVGGTRGYGAALLASITKSVTSVECDKSYLDLQRKHHRALGFLNVEYALRELAYGAKGEKPFDGILVEGAVAEKPLALTGLLARGGRLVAVVVPEGAQIGQVILVERTESGVISSRPLFEAWAPYLPGCGPLPHFSFT